MDPAQEFVTAALDLLFPRNCQACGQPLTEKEHGVICGVCLATVKWIEPPCCLRCSLPFCGAVEGPFECGYCKEMEFHFSGAVAAALARGVVRLAIHEFKYNGKLYFAPHLVDWIVTAGCARVDWSAVDGIVPIPLHPRKQREREFNQAEILADALGKAFKKPVWNRCLRRVRDTPTQTHLNRQERIANLRRAFAVRPDTALKRARVLLVDDVFTTGATLDACAKVLRKAGAADVRVLTVARAAYL